jgi:hypothetical protein
MGKKSKMQEPNKFLTQIAQLQERVAEQEKLVAVLRRENFRLQNALPPPSLGVYLFLEVDGSLAASLQTETSTRYSIRVDESEKGLQALLKILRTRQTKLTRAYASDACPTQARVDEMMKEWASKNTISSGNTIRAKDFQP